MFEWLKKKARQAWDWAEEHPLLAVTVVVVSVIVTGRIAYLVIRNKNGEDELIAMPQDLMPQMGDDDELKDIDVKESKALEEPEPEVESVGDLAGMDLPDEESFAYRLGSRREHLRNIAPRNASDRARALAALSDIDLPEHFTLVRSSNPRIRCAVDDPRAVIAITPINGEEEINPLDL